MKIYGNIMLRGSFIKGILEIKDGVIVDFKKGWHRYDVRGTVIPTLINMHTHLGDFCATEEPPHRLEEAVGPGGYKYRILENEENVLKGMRRAMQMMERSGVSHFVDFREGGKRGVELLLRAASRMKIRPIILGREDVWEKAHGVSFSCVTDDDKDRMISLSIKARNLGKMVALHLSERIREDVKFVVSLKPDFVVHAIETTDEDLEMLKNARIPVVITPRANAFFGKLPDVHRLIRHKITVAIGTDNGMVAAPSIIREMEFLYRISCLNGCLSPETIIKMATYNPRKILKIEDNYIGGKASVVIFRRLLTPYEIVAKATERDIKTAVF